MVSFVEFGGNSGRNSVHHQVSTSPESTTSLGPDPPPPLLPADRQLFLLLCAGSETTTASDMGKGKGASTLPCSQARVHLGHARVLRLFRASLRQVRASRCSRSPRTSARKSEPYPPKPGNTQHWRLWLASHCGPWSALAESRPCYCTLRSDNLTPKPSHSRAGRAASVRPSRWCTTGMPGCRSGMERALRLTSLA